MGLGEAQLCDACYNDRVAALTGSAPLPRPPPPMVIIGPEWTLAPAGISDPAGAGRRRRSSWRRPAWTRARAMTSPSGAITMPMSLRSFARSARSPSARWPVSNLEPATHGVGWRVTDGDEVVGRFIWSDEGAAGAPFDVVIDGRTLTWEQFGEALSAHEGWSFRLLIEDRVAEAETRPRPRSSTSLDIAAGQVPCRRSDPAWA